MFEFYANDHYNLKNNESYLLLFNLMIHVIFHNIKHDTKHQKNCVSQPVTSWINMR
jgi:hypothetical protein